MFAVQQTYLEKIPNAQGCLYLDQAQLDNFLTTVPTVIIPVGISNLGSHKSKKCGSYWSTVLSIIGAAARPPNVWLRVLLLLMISQNGVL